MYTLTKEKFEELTAVTIEKLFPNQNISPEFREDLKNFIEKRFNELGCCVLYLPKSPEFSAIFRKFMDKYPKMSCGMRQVIIYKNGALDFRENYSTALPDRAIVAPKFIPKQVDSNIDDIDNYQPWKNWDSIPQQYY